MVDDSENVEPITDLLEFYEHWPTLRSSMVALAASSRLDAGEQKTLQIMIALVDRVGPSDFLQTPRIRGAAPRDP